MSGPGSALVMTTKTIYESGKRLIKTNAFVSLAGNGASAVLGLLTLALLARVCSKEEFGKWILFLTVYSLTDALRSGLILSALVKHIAGEQDTAVLKRWAGATWQLSGAFVGLMALLFVCLIVVASWFGYGGQWPALAGWIVGLSIVAIPVNISGWLLQARSQFIYMQTVRVSVQVLFIAGITIGHYTNQLDSMYLFASYTITHTLVGVVVLLTGWAQGSSIWINAVQERRSLLGFGRFSMGTLLVSNLLRTSDRLLLGAFMGPEAVVVYTLPQRLLELIEMPIRSIVITDMPRLAQLYTNSSLRVWADFLNQQSGRLWVALLPLSIGGFLAAGPLVHLLGGEGYSDSINVLRFFMIYALILPIDRYLGVGLDVVNKPQLNLLKVICMLVVNVIGDAIAILVFKSVVGVAFVSITTFALGWVLGFRFLRAYAPISFLGSIQTGFITALHFVKHVRHEWAR